MPERLQQVTVSLSTGDVIVPWEVRQTLLNELGKHTPGREIRVAFEAVGATRPVTLTQPQKTYLLEVIEQWAVETVNGFDALPDAILTLRNTLHDDLHDAEQRQSE